MNEIKSKKEILDIIENFEGGVQKSKMRMILLLVMILLLALLVFCD
jgi:hypothetical protein